jgi:quercetin dioxygenase-like cupin family protein
MSSNGNATSGSTAPVIWARRSETTAFSPAPGVNVQPVIGENVMTCWIEIEPNAIIAEHQHSNEQLGVVIDGSVTITVGGETRTVEVGDAYVVASDQLHHAVAGPHGVTVVETFVPVREDYRRAWLEATTK